jgi:hypothetical protein
MRIWLALTFAAFLMPSAAVAADPVIAVDCLCVEDEQGWVRGRGDATTSEAGLEPLTTGESMIVLRADADRCTKYASSCGDERFTPMTGERRARLDGVNYMLIDDDFRLTVDGVTAPPPGDEPLIEVDCVCVWEDTGSIEVLSDEPAGRLGLAALMPRETVVRFKGREQGCTKHAAACSSTMTPATGEVRATINYFDYPRVEGDYTVRVYGDLQRE